MIDGRVICLPGKKGLPVQLPYRGEYDAVVSQLETVSYTDLGISPCFGETVVSIEVYLDESLDGKKRVVAGGLVSSVDRWAKFASVWKH
jgi:hypothetical protein